ncbi:Nuclear import receptor [Tulasnella sp. 332]|nr:Nuclear import receptor [Tulasnella sp. 332]
MTSTPDDSIQKVLAALEVFSAKPDKVSLDQANTWLQEFQHSVTHDLHQLDASQRAGLRDSLLAAMGQYANGPRTVLVQVSLALSGLAIQMKEWDDAVPSLIEGLGRNPVTVAALLQFLTVLPEEVSGNTRIPISNEDFAFQEARLLTANAPQILDLLNMYCQATGITPLVQAGVFKCLRSWMITGEITPASIAETPLLALAFTSLDDEQLFDFAVDTIWDLIHETQEIEENRTVIEAVLPRLLALRPKLAAACQADDSEKVRGLCRIFTEAGETYRMLVLQHPDTFFPIVEAIGECAAYTDLDVVQITFPFWFRLAQSIGKKQNVPVPFLNAYRALMAIIVGHLHFPENPESLTAQERDDFRAFRHIMGDTLKDCCYVLGTEGCLTRVYDMITAAMARGTSGGKVEWQEIEAPLFSMRSMGAEVNPDDEEVIPKIMDLIPQLPSHPRVRYAATLVISRYSDWTDKHPSYIPFQLSYISAGFEDADTEVAAAAGQAMKYMCKDCKKHLVLYLPQLHTFVQTVGPRLIQDDRLQVYEAIAYIISSMSMNEAGQTFRSFALDLVTQVHAVLGKAAAATPDELQTIADALELLETMLHVIQSFGEELPPACKDTAVQIYGVLDNLIAKHGRHYFISERVCRVIRMGIQFYGDSARSLVPAMLQRVATAFHSSGFSSFLWLLGKATSFYAAEQDAALLRAFKDAYEMASLKVFAMVKSQPAADMPDVIEDYMHFVLQMIDFFPEFVFLSPTFPACFQTILTALTLVPQDILFPALDLLRIILAHESLAPGDVPEPPTYPPYASAIRQVVTENGFQLVGIVLTGLVTYFPEDTTQLVVSLFRIMAGIWPTELKAWIFPVVEQIPASSLPLPAKAQICSDFGSALTTGLFSANGGYLLAFAMLFGMNIWNNFIGGFIAVKTLPRHQFGMLQAKQFPWFFGISTTLAGFLLSRWIYDHPNVIPNIMQIWNVDVLQTLTLAMVTTMYTLNMLFISPATTKVMFQRHRLEREEKKPHTDPDVSAEMKELNKSFGMLHGASSLTTLIATFGTVFHGLWLASHGLGAHRT